MAKKSDVLDAFYEELQTILSNETSLTSEEVDDRTGLLDRADDAAYPFLGFEAFGRPENHGIPGNVHVDAILTDSNDEFTGIRYRRDFVLTVDVGVLVDDGDAVQKDDLLTAVLDHVQQFDGNTAPGDPSDLHSDVNWFDPGPYEDESDPSRGVHGDRLTLELSYSRYKDVTTSDSSISKMDTVDITIENDETGADYLTDSVN